VKQACNALHRRIVLPGIFESLYRGPPFVSTGTLVFPRDTSTIESDWGAAAVDLVKLGMSPEALVQFGGMLKLAREQPRSRAEKQNFVVRAFVAATPFLKDSPDALELFAAVSRNLTSRGEMFPTEGSFETSHPINGL